MAPKEKVERKYTPPSFIDEKIIRNLSPEKRQYWANRILGHPGQGPKPKKSEAKPTDGGITTFDNNGNMVIKNRAARRQRPATDPKYTKATHSLKKARNK